jgi:hypothetical protein
MGLAMRRINISELHELGVRSLGLDASSLDLTSVEGIAGALRRAAGFSCPCSEEELIAYVFQSIRDLVSNTEELRDLIDATLQALVGYGDLVECRMLAGDAANNSNTLLYLTPPSFVARRDGSVFLLGIAPDDLSPLPAQYLSRVERDGHVRRIQPLTEENLALCLVQFGFWELPLDQWLRTPLAEPARQYLTRFDERLGSSPPAGSIPGLRMLDPSKSVRFYPGRWTQLRNQTGKFVGRRPQAYGADLWCYAEIENGHIQKMLDFPQFEKRWRPCDEAWRLQSAIDACNSKPQHYRVRPGPTRETSVLDLFSPVPLWAQRRWDLTGHPTPRSGSLFSYVLPASALDEELRFLKSMLWLIDSREVG